MSEVDSRLLRFPFDVIPLGSGAKVKSLSPNRRLMIAVLSPDELVETGLRERTPEKNAL